ncbi:MmgE/PrpD family protein [Alloalcanivorax xenomutans]|uniref:MmgE/PrpD family protein n=1 Tax=Alloalcanivorax xenomutans TaxID=1094342 RepID=UPI00292E0407|nr:MmgE/PrpD family protein [Alloalcanivorax xenomutans]WOA32174.1 MmgE/PrpD family protein [Alloalcanivorax xenomutans]WOD29138.1 MmgE/PrpD family protein [Alloalcanivorax xenomutans]
MTLVLEDTDVRTITPLLSDWIAGVPGEDIPPALIRLLRDCFFDITGHAAFSARYAESSAAIREGVQSMEIGGGGYTVFGDSGDYSSRQAALLNGAFAHSMDFDDTNVPGVLHPGASVIPAALVEAERIDCDGRGFLEALAVGYEVACRVGAAIGESAYDLGFHTTSVAGIFGAVAAAGRLRTASASVIEDAFGLAGSMAAGSMQYLENGAWNKRLHPGLAARSALDALDLAQAGVVGAHEPLVGRYGVLNGYSRNPRPDLLGRDLGREWLALKTGLKPYPSCRLTHGAVDAALVLRERFPTAEPVAISIELSPKAFDIVGEPTETKKRPRNTVDAQFSVYFQVACAWRQGRMDWRSYQNLGEPSLEALMATISVRPDAALAGPAARLTVGSEELVVEVPSGEPESPLGEERLRQKFYSMAAEVYGDAGSRHLADQLLDIESCGAVSDLIRALKPPS